MDYITYATLVAYIITFAYYIFSIKKMKKENDERNFNELVHKIIENETFKNALVEAVNNSDLNKKLDTLITVLCTTDERIRDLKICK